MCFREKTSKNGKDNCLTGGDPEVSRQQLRRLPPSWERVTLIKMAGLFKNS